MLSNGKTIKIRDRKIIHVKCQGYKIKLTFTTDKTTSSKYNLNQHNHSSISGYLRCIYNCDFYCKATLEPGKKFSSQIVLHWFESCDMSIIHFLHYRLDYSLNLFDQRFLYCL